MRLFCCGNKDTSTTNIQTLQNNGRINEISGRDEPETIVREEDSERSRLLNERTRMIEVEMGRPINLSALSLFLNQRTDGTVAYPCPNACNMSNIGVYFINVNQYSCTVSPSY